MYSDDLATIGKTDDNKFLLSVKYTEKKDEKKDDHNIPMQDMTKTYVAHDEQELLALIQEYVTGDPDASDTTKFKKGFEKGTKKHK